LEEKVTGDFVGEVGFADYQREVEPGLGAVPEAGWVLTPQKQGMGYATEAVRAVLDWGKEHLAAALVSCLIHPDHHASIRVARRCGFIKRQLGSYNGKPVLIFDLLLSDAGGSGKNG
jgi:RimJ/RimL family protein N-acetyltransferase